MEEEGDSGLLGPLISQHIVLFGFTSDLWLSSLLDKVTLPQRTSRRTLLWRESPSFL